MKKKITLSVLIMIFTITNVIALSDNNTDDRSRMFGINIAVPKYTFSKEIYGLNFGTPVSFNLYDVYGIDLGGIFSSTDNVNGIQASLLFNMSNLMDILQKIIKLKEQEALKKDQAEKELQYKTDIDDLEGVKLSNVESNVEKVKEYIPKWLNLNKKYKASVNGLQLALLLNMSKYLNGGQLAFVNLITKRVNGFQIGLVNLSDKDYNGIQAGVLNNLVISGNGLQTAVFSNNADSFNGLQLALFNDSKDEINGIQLGLTNTAKTVSGVQIGLYNSTEKGYALQIGLLNHIKNGWIPYFPIINIGF